MEAADYGGWNDNKYDSSENKLERPSPPPVLTLALQCETWNALPRAGGVLDQPYGLLSKMTIVKNYYYAAKRYSELSADEVGDFISKNPDVYNIIKSIEELRKRHG